MIRLLPFILIPILLIAGLGYWRFAAIQKGLSSPQTTTKTSSSLDTQSSIEVPKTLPATSLEDRVTSLEDTISKLVPKVNNLSSSTTQPSNNLEFRVSTLESSMTDLKSRVSALEKATPVPASSSKYPLYIPLGSGGGPWGNQYWYTTKEYQVSINPDNYPGYTSVQLEANFRILESAGTGSVRLYNVTDNSSVGSQLDTTSTTFSLQSTGGFKLAAGQKTYALQILTSQGKDLFVQTARLKVNF